MNNSLRNKLSTIISLAQIYLLKKVSGKSTLNYIDIGASGLKKPNVAIPFKNFKLIAFEPDPRKRNNFKNFPFKIEFYPYAISGIKGIQKLYLTNKPHCSSLKKPINNGDKRYGVEKIIDVECKTIDDLCINADILKIDAQGAESEILNSSVETLKQINVVELEAWFINKYHDQSKIDEIHEFLTSKGFLFIGFTSLYFDNFEKGLNNGISFGDMLFIREKVNLINKKTIISALVSSGFDHLINKLDGLEKYSFFERLLLNIIIILGLFKPTAPRIH